MNDNEQPPRWQVGALSLERTSRGYIYVFDQLRQLSSAQIGELLMIFSLPRHLNLARPEEEFVLGAVIQHRFYQEVVGKEDELGKKFEASRATFTARYKDLVDRLEKGEQIMAKEKATRKEKSAKKEKKPKVPKVRGDFYEVSAREPKELGKQAAIVYQAIKEHGPAQPSTLAVKINGNLETRQPVERVVAFYLASFKRSGYVKVSEGPAASA